ncbi:twin-arginine translocase subunit TatC [candidate division KSB1 bacterium]|nr:twin-arginine translocase subunit TatC [candidate division KSB1 bacterium]
MPGLENRALGIIKKLNEFLECQGMKFSKNIFRDAATFALHFLITFLLALLLAYILKNQVSDLCQSVIPEPAKPLIADNWTANPVNSISILLLAAWIVLLFMSCIYWATIIAKSKTLFVILSIVTLINLLSLLFSLFVGLPSALNYLTTFLMDFANESTIEINVVVKFFLVFTIIISLLCQFPVFLLGNLKAGIITRKNILKYYRFGLYMILLLSAILTPPDLLTFVLFSFPAAFFYLAICLIAGIYHKKIEDFSELVNIQKGRNYAIIIFFLLVFSSILMPIFTSNIGSLEIILIILSVPIIEGLHFILKKIILQNIF